MKMPDALGFSEKAPFTGPIWPLSRTVFKAIEAVIAPDPWRRALYFEWPDEDDSDNSGKLRGSAIYRWQTRAQAMEKFR